VTWLIMHQSTTLLPSQQTIHHNGRLSTGWPSMEDRQSVRFGEKVIGEFSESEDEIR